ncbi:MAG: hypothetical protein L0229_16430 [Blastocatellia bacterium]|nr:hypothetical protein [Blastocatellia bacterium]
MRNTRTDDLLESDAAQETRERLDPSPLLGTWLNTDGRARGIIKIAFRMTGDSFKAHALGACEPSPCDWGEVDAALFADTAASLEGTNFSAFYDFGFMDAHLQGYIRQGVLVVATFNRFKDGSRRSNYFTKEFFYRLETAS